MAEFKFPCPQCGQHIQCDTGYAGMQIDCPICKRVILVPQPPRAAATPPVSAKSRTWRNVLVVAALVVALAGLITAGWFGYSKIKFHRNPVINTPNLLGYWRFSPDAPTKNSFGTNLAIFSGNAIVGPAGSGPRWDTTAILLDGNASYVTTTLVGGLAKRGPNANQGSIIVWFKLAALPSNAGRIFFLAGESVSGNDFDLQIEPSDNRLRFYTDGGSCTVSTNPLTAGDINVWHFVAVTFISGASRKIYLNGVQVGSSVPGPHNPAHGGTFSIGDSHFFTGRYA